MATELEKRLHQQRYRAVNELIEATKQYQGVLLTSADIQQSLKQKRYDSTINFIEILLTELEADKNECLKVLRGE